MRYVFVRVSLGIRDKTFKFFLILFLITRFRWCPQKLSLLSRRFFSSHHSYFESVIFILNFIFKLLPNYWQLAFEIYSSFWNLVHARDKTKNIFLFFFTELKTYHLPYLIILYNLRLLPQITGRRSAFPPKGNQCYLLTILTWHCIKNTTAREECVSGKKCVSGKRKPMLFINNFRVTLHIKYYWA